MSNIIVALVTVSSRTPAREKKMVLQKIHFTHFFNLLKNYCNKPRLVRSQMMLNTKPNILIATTMVSMR